MKNIADYPYYSNRNELLLGIIGRLLLDAGRRGGSEEAYLEGKFGDSYAEYKNSVRRWL